MWPENWRETVSKDDAKKLAQLQRYASPQVMADALFAAQERIRSGELKPVLAKNATPEQLKEWRTAHGIPETADKYNLGDVKIDETDKPMMDAVISSLHAANATPEVVQATAKAWNTIKKNAMDNQATADLATQQASEDALRAEWGTEFRRNINIVHGLLDGAASPGLKDKLLGGRMADGTPIGSSPEVLKMLVGLALIQNPAGVVVPNGNGNVEATVDAEIDTIEKRMRTDRKGYDKDEKQQARYRELLDAREKLKPKK